MPAVVATSASRPRRSLWVRARRRMSGDRCRAGWRRLATGGEGALAGWSGDCGDVAVFEIDGLMQAPTEGGREPDEDVLAGDVALFDLGDPALGDAHPVGHLLLGQAPGTAHLRQSMPDQFVEEFLLGAGDRLLTAGAGDL